MHGGWEGQVPVWARVWSCVEVALELFPADGERSEEVCDDRCTALGDDEQGERRRMGQEQTCLATSDRLDTLPLNSISRDVPIGVSVTVMTEMDSAMVQREDRVLPGKPKVRTVERSEEEPSLDV